MTDKCRCGRPLFGENEQNFGSCNRCLDRMAERESRRREWDYYHPDEPCPQSELEP